MHRGELVAPGPVIQVNGERTAPVQPAGQLQVSGRAQQGQRGELQSSAVTLALQRPLAGLQTGTLTPAITGDLETLQVTAAAYLPRAHQ